MSLRAARSVVAVLTFFIAAAVGQPVQGADKLSVEVRAQLGHSGESSEIALSPDGRLAASGGRDGSLKLWDTATGRLLRDLYGHVNEITDLTFSSDSRRLLSGSLDTTVALWDVVTGQEIKRFDANRDRAGWIWSIAFLPNGHVISAGSWQPLRIWDPVTGALLRTIDFKGNRWFQVSPDGERLLAYGGAGDMDDQPVELWDLKSGKRLRSFPNHVSHQRAFAFSRDGRSIILITKTAMEIWDPAASKPTSSTRLERYPLAFSPDRNRVAAQSADTRVLELRETSSGAVAAAFALKDCPLPDGSPSIGEVSKVAFTPDGATMLVRSNTGTLHVWAAGKCVRTFITNPSRLRAAVYSRDGRFIVAGGADKKLRLWSASSGSLLKTLSGHLEPIQAVAISADGRLLLSSSMDKTVKLWDANTGRLVRSLDESAGEIWAATFSADGRQIVGGGTDRIIRLWDTDTGALRHAFDSKLFVLALAISPSGHQVAIATDGGCRPKGTVLSVFDVAKAKIVFEAPSLDTRKPKYDCDAARSIAFSADGARVLSGNNDRTLRLWDIASGKLLRTYEGHRGSINSAVFSPDGRFILSSGTDYTVRLWDANTAQLLRTYDLTLQAYSVAFSPDGRYALLACDDGVTVWSLDKGEDVVTLIANPVDQWLALTPAGFFEASAQGGALLHAVRGLEVIELDQVFAHLYRPDLVGERLKGDPEDRYKDAASKLNLGLILESGPAPQIDQVAEKREQAGNTIRLGVRITGTGGGVGPKLVWRVNGVTQGNPAPPELASLTSPLASAVVTETLKVLPGQTNVVEVTAYNRAGLVMTPPHRVTVDAFGVTTRPRPRMFVLALGVDAYRMEKYVLRHAANDATTFAKALEVVGSTLFARVIPKVLTDHQVNEVEIDAAIAKIAGEANPEDVLVLYLAGHGKSSDGKYYYYPQTLDFERARHRVVEHAVSQDKWQAWLARVPAQKSMLVIDTCESDAAGVLVRGTDRDIVRQTAMAQLQHATGHSLIAAARNAAYEGYQGHGILTYALLEALDAKQAQATPEIVKVGSLADYAYERVPQITQSLYGEEQKPYRRMSGENFAIGVRQAVLTAAATIASIPKESTHALRRDEVLREKPAAGARGSRTLKAFYRVRPVEFLGEWVLVARDGQKLGYLPADAIGRLD